MRKVGSRLVHLGLAIGMAAAMMSFVQQAAAEWQPKKPVEFVIMAGTGGGADRLARLIQSIIQKNGFSNQPFIPINKGGGSGAEALRYLVDKEGDPHVIMATLNSLYTTPLRNPSLGVDISKFRHPARCRRRACGVSRVSRFVRSACRRTALDGGIRRVSAIIST